MKLRTLIFIALIVVFVVGYRRIFGSNRPMNSAEIVRKLRDNARSTPIRSEKAYYYELAAAYLRVMQQ